MSFLLNIYYLFNIECRVIKKSRCIVCGIIMGQLLIMMVLKLVISIMNDKSQLRDPKIFPIHGQDQPKQQSLQSQKQIKQNNEDINDNQQTMEINFNFKSCSGVKPQQPHPSQKKHFSPPLQLMPCYRRNNQKKKSELSHNQNQKKKFSVIFELPHDENQLDSGTSQQPESGLSSMSCQPLVEKGEKQDKSTQIERNRLGMKVQDFHTLSILLGGHSFIAFSFGILYFPFLILPILGGLHLFILILLTLFEILLQEECHKKLVRRTLTGGIFCINLLAIGCGLLGIMKAQGSSYQP